jgi:uncharacterized protein (TIGR02001 family)
LRGALESFCNGCLQPLTGNQQTPVVGTQHASETVIATNLAAINHLYREITMRFATLSTLAAVAAAASIAAPVAQAQQAAAAAPASPHSFSANVALVSDYRFRGISQTYKRPAIQGGFDYSHSSGLYAGVWGSSVSGHQYPHGASLELDFYGGWKKEFSNGIGLDVGLLQYYYPGARYYTAAITKSGNKFSNTEAYIGLSYKWFTLKYNHTLSNFFGVKTATYGGACGATANFTATTDCFGANPGNSRGSGYLDLTAKFEVLDKTNLILHAGHQSVKNYGRLSYTDYKIGLEREFDFATLGIAFTGTNAKKDFYRAAPRGTFQNGTGSTRQISGSAIVLSVAKTFSF